MPNQPVILSILIVEDNLEKLDAINRVIEGTGVFHKSDVVRDQITAQQRLVSRSYDLLVLDMQLPLRPDTHDINEKAGENILEDLSVDSAYKTPTGIIALTEFEDLELMLRDNYPEIAVLRFDPTSTKWRDGLSRKVKSSYKSKAFSKTIVYCEGNDMPLYNAVDLVDVMFISLTDSRAIYLAAKNEKDRLALRDRDFLTTSEVNRLRQKYSNYCILDYYCLENYLYHPDNIMEVRAEFDREGYVADIRSQKNQKLLWIVQDYKISRASYNELIGNDKANCDREPELDIVKSLESQDFETFYRYFDMAGKKDKDGKKSYDKSFVSSLNLTREELAKTNWFKQRLKALLKI